jgi:hypothetical protein
MINVLFGNCRHCYIKFNMTTKPSMVAGVVLSLSACLCLVTQAPLSAKQRVLVLTDISNEPDDEESMVRFLVYSSEYDVEGLIATTSTWLRSRPREDLIRRQIGAYSQVRENLSKHAPGYPTANQLLALTFTGQTNYGLAATGQGMATPGSSQILAAADKPDERPLWVSIWGGANTLAQALIDARRERSTAELAKLVSKLKIYSISDQDDAGPWLRREFPELFWIVSPSTPGPGEYHRATWTGISGDRFYRNGPMHKFAMVDNPWLEEHIIKNHGPLGALYPRLSFIMEGDTPSFLGLIDNGLGWAESPAYGGWGGRYSLYQTYGETRPCWTNNRESRDTVTADTGCTETSDMATIWRWREQYQSDFAARMDWCTADDYKKANHNPIVILNGDATKRVLHISATPGSTVTLSAAGSSDPDGNNLAFSWFVYSEAGGGVGGFGDGRKLTLSSTNEETTSFVLNAGGERGRGGRSAGTGGIHIILSVQDNGTPNLWAYRRAIIRAKQ